MASVITPRIGSVPGGVSVQGSGVGIIQCSNVAGTDVITCDTFPTIESYIADRIYAIRPLNINTGPVDINMEGIGVRNWKTAAGNEFAAGEVSPNIEYLIKDNGTEFRALFA